LCQFSAWFGRWRLKTLLLTTLIFLQAAVPFTPEPRSTQWRIGFDLGNAVILETPELIRKVIPGWLLKKRSAPCPIPR
jgi:hypothetical protein